MVFAESMILDIGSVHLLVGSSSTEPAQAQIKHDQMLTKKIVPFILFFFFCSAAFSQDEKTERAASSAKLEEHEHHSMKGSHRFTLGLGHTHVSEGQIGNKTQWLGIASWSFNYDYWLSDKWAVGLQNDILLESFKIEGHDGVEIERDYPLAFVPVAIFKPGAHFSFIGGVGAEIAGGHSLTLTRVGVEYGWHVARKWEVGAAAVWDIKWKYYNTWGISFTVSRIWPKEKK